MGVDKFPFYSVSLDCIFYKYKTVIIIGDIHDNERTFISFAFEKGYVFLSRDNVDLNNISNYIVRSDILLIFLGDVLYKTRGHFKSIMRFILNNKDNCLLILGNNEIKFVFEHINLLMDFSQQFLSHSFLRSIQKAIDNKDSLGIINQIYFLVKQLRQNDENSKLKRDWMWYYFCFFYEYLLDKTNCEDLMILMYILTDSIILGYSEKLKLILVHAGLNPRLRLQHQRISDLCNIRYVKRSKKVPWYHYYANFKYTILFGHWSKLTKFTGMPYSFANVLCLDTECYKTNVLSYVIISPNSSSSKYRGNLNVTTYSSGFNTFHEITFI